MSEAELAVSEAELGVSGAELELREAELELRRDVCPVCGRPGGTATVARDRLPAMQNAVHRTRAAAVAAAEGAFRLAACACGFAWNAAFDASRLRYDDSYDNAVPSAVMAAYYEEIAEHLGRTYEVERGYVVDVGCGDGRFLKVLARRWPGCRALGVDPALARDERHADGRVRLVKGVFDAALLDAAPTLVLSRHVLEHMPEPVAFMRTIRQAIRGAGVPFFAEVPDLRWILAHRAFWDFCYEHCNYFSEASLAATFVRAGFTPVAARLGFGSQYRWIEAVTAADAPGGSAPAVPADPSLRDALAAYAAEERETVAAARARLASLRAAGAAVAIWGMATKGVIYSLLVDPESSVVDAAVDINPNKQGGFVPLSGRAIEAPGALARFAGRTVAVVVMNPNYLAEIRGACASLGVSARLLDATGQEALAA